MKFIDGINLQSYLEKTSLTETELLNIYPAGIEAHRLGIEAHRLGIAQNDAHVGNFIVRVSDDGSVECEVIDWSCKAYATQRQPAQPALCVCWDIDCFRS
jgi:hypothetical protein